MDKQMIDEREEIKQGGNQQNDSGRGGTGTWKEITNRLIEEKRELWEELAGM